MITLDLSQSAPLATDAHSQLCCQRWGYLRPKGLVELKRWSQDENWQGGYCSLASMFSLCWICYAETKPHSLSDLFFKSHEKRVTREHTGTRLPMWCLLFFKGMGWHQKLIETDKNLSMGGWGRWRDGSMVRSTYCSSRGPELNSQHPHQAHSHLQL